MIVTEDQRAAFKDLVASIQGAKRREQSAKIKLLSDLLGVTEDLTQDRRKYTWQENSTAKAKVAALAVRKKTENRVYKVEFENCDPMMCNLAEASVWAKKKESSMAVYLSKGRGRAFFMVNDEPLKITKTDFLESK